MKSLWMLIPPNPPHYLQQGVAFLQEPIFLHAVSASCHLILLLLLSTSHVLKRFKDLGHGHPQVAQKGCSFHCHKASLFACLGLSLFYLCLSVFNNFVFWNFGWPAGSLSIQLDSAARTIAWLAVAAYLHFEFSQSNEKRFPILLRTWWGFYFLLSCIFIIMDFVFYRKKGFLSIQSWVFDFVSVFFASFLCYAGIFGKRKEEAPLPLQEPLLGAKRGKDRLTPYASAGPFSILTFAWLGPLLKVGSKKPLDLDDVPLLADVDRARSIFQILKCRFEESCSSSNDSNATTPSNKVETLKLVKALLFSAWKEILLTALSLLILKLCSFVGPYLIDTLVQYIDGGPRFTNEGFYLVSAFVISNFIESVAERHWFFKVEQLHVRVKAGLVAMVYKKGLLLSSTSRQANTTGEIINIMTIDTERIGIFSWFLHDIWSIPLQLAIAMLILYKNLGLASVFALLATVVLVVLNYPLGHLQEKYQEELMKAKDARMKVTSEILRNMRILKLQGWEMKFLSKINERRKSEENWLKKFLYSSATMKVFFWAAPTFVAAITFLACIPLGIPLEAGKVLSSLATFLLLQEPVYSLPDFIATLVQTKVSLYRIASFFYLEELDPDAVQRLPCNGSHLAIEIIDGSFSWNPSSVNPTLKSLNLEVSRGMRVAVCGVVGSGKSTLLSCILGEVPKISGAIKSLGTRAYVAQSPWIQSGKIEENILFGKEMDREWYELVLEACSLKKDLETFSFGDQTIIGERGINLSGGQKQRIQIARALYQDADIYLFDDPFSAVDAHTGTHLFKECILRILSSKTVIYITHQVEFLPAADLILVMKDGKIMQAGKYNDILSSGTDFQELVSAHKHALSALDSLETLSSAGSSIARSISTSLKEGSSDAGEETYMTNSKEEANVQSDDTDGIVMQEQLVQEEERGKGRVGLSVYWKYITTSYKGLLVPLILLAQVLFLILEIASSFWMALGTPVSKEGTTSIKSSLLILVYVVLALGSSFSVLIRALLLAKAGYETATLLFKKMHHCVFRAPMLFFDSTPSGRILSRASTDQSEADVLIPDRMGAFAFIVLKLIGTIAVMSQVAWQVFIIFIPIVAICIWYQRYFIVTAQELTRLIGVCKAPCIQHFAESLSGSATIRSFDQESRFCERNLQMTDDYSRVSFHNSSSMEWLCFRLNFLSTLVFTFSLIFLISMPKGIIDAAIAGLVVTYGLNLNHILTRVILNLCTVEKKIISIERIFQYMSIPSEPPLVIENRKPNRDWPAYGEVEICNLKVRYAPHLPLVLRGVSCTFHGGKKTGIVGRTGSGKSTLIQTLFRMVDPVNGWILIDGVNILTIGLHDLRSRLSIIPQDPTMFEGTLRINLDPLEEYTDEQIWDALDKCQLGEEVRQKEGLLESAVAENGENWSMGQRQLVCLGRVILKRSKVLVLDEATASVDTATDNLIQQTLAKQFMDSTVITIAHRITSVLGSDMVLLLDNGFIAEYDTPAKLLENRSSLFAKLVAEYSARSGSNFGN